MEKTETTTKFANNLHWLRIAKGLSQNQLGALVGVNQRTVSAWEKGICEPDYATLAQLCTIFDEDYNGLLG